MIKFKKNCFELNCNCFELKLDDHHEQTEETWEKVQVTDEKKKKADRDRGWEREVYISSPRAASCSCGAVSRVFTPGCQQVRVGDKSFWCCQPEFIPPNFISSPRPLFRLQRPPHSHLALIQEHTGPSVQSSFPSSEAPSSKNCNPNFSFPLLLQSSNYIPSHALTNLCY